MGPSKVLTTFPLQFRALGSFHFWNCPNCCVPASSTVTSTVTPPCKTVTSSSDFSGLYTSTVEPGPPLLTLHSRPTLVFKPLIPRLPILFLFPLPPPHRLLLLPVLLRLLLPLLLTFSGFFNGMLEVSVPGPLNYLTFSRPIQESNLNSSFRIPGFSALRSDCTHSRSSILSRDATHASGGVVIFVRQGLFFSELFTSSLSSLDPYSDYVGVNISLNNSSSLSFLNVYPPPQWMSEPTPLPPSEISLFWGTLIAITPSGTQESLPTPVGRKYLTGSSPLTFSPAMTQTHPSFSIAPLAVAPLLTSPMLRPLLPFLAPGRCFRTWVLTIYQLFYLSLSLRSLSLSLSLRSFAPMSVPHPSIFRKLAGMALPPTLTLTVFQPRNTRLFLFPLLLLSLPL